MNLGGFNFTNFRGVNLRNTAAVRLEMDGGFAGTVAARSSPDTNRQWFFPDKSGTFPIMGTFRVQFPASIAEGEFSTAVTVSGIRAEDALVVQLNGVGVAGTTYGFANSTGWIMTQAIPTNGGITLMMHNFGQGSGYVDLQASYLAAR